MAADLRPTLAGFVAFARDIMGITTAQLPDASPYFELSFSIALEIVNLQLAQASQLIYQQAVYNLSGSSLLNFAQDPSNAPVYKDNMKFFAYTRKNLNLTGFVGGVIQAANDESTGESMVVPEAAKNFTLANLQQLKDPYGRQYLSYMQSLGPSVWGLT